MASPYHFAASVPACGAFRRPLQDLVRHALKYGGEAPDQAEAGASAVVGLLGPADLGGTVTLTLEGHDGELTIRLRGAHLPATPAAAGALGEVAVSRDGHDTVYELRRRLPASGGRE